jgi:ParB-like chromosome segregation protein Spo0J
MKNEQPPDIDSPELPFMSDIQTNPIKTEKSVMASAVFDHLSTLSGDALINEINLIRTKIHEVSPFRNEPVDLVLWVRSDAVFANDYNPNNVAPPEMELLRLSIAEDGYTQPIVTFDEQTRREVIDGFHRHRVGKECLEIQTRIHGYLPVVTINESRQDKGDRIASTIRHNRARGKHRVDSMSDIVVELRKRNWSEEKIAKHLGMDSDEVLRLTQISGLSELFADQEFSKSWEIGEVTSELDEIELE